MSITQRTILKGVIEDSLRAFPEEAHHKVLQYLVDSGMDESQSIKFRQSWSKVVLGSQAFGRNNKQSIDPRLFSEELIRELSYSDEEVTRLINATSSCLKLDHHRSTVDQSSKSQVHSADVRNPRDTIAALDAVTNMGAELSQVLAGLYKEFKAKENKESVDLNTELFESIGLFRKSLRGTRLHWGGNLLPADVVYLPLDGPIHGLPDIVKGRLDMQLRTDRQDLNEYTSTDELIGVVVSSKQAVHQERGWNAYLSLNELLSSQGLNIFPLPVGVHRESATLSTTFAFELAAGCQSLCTLFGPALSTYLRRLPSVLHRWCAQLAQAHRSLLRCSGSLMKLIRINTDVFVRDSGNLLVGNVAFDTTPPGNRPGYSENFLRVCCELLQRALCISREENMQLRDESSYGGSTGTGIDEFSALDGLGGGEGGVGGLQGHGQVLPEEDVVLAVVVGCTLQLNVSGHHCSSLVVQDTRTVVNAAVAAERSSVRSGYLSNTHTSLLSTANSSSSSSSSSTTTLLVDAAVSQGSFSDYVQTECVNENNAGGGSLRLSLKALKPGVLSLHMSARVLESDDCAGTGASARTARYRHRGCRVRIVLVPQYSVESVLVQDLIGHLEECHARTNPQVILHSQLFIRPQCSATTEEDADSANHNQTNAHSPSQSGSVKPLVNHPKDVQRGWEDIKRVIENHGNFHTPKSSYK